MAGHGRTGAARHNGQGRIGRGDGYFRTASAVEEITRASVSVGLSYGAHSNLCVNQIQRGGTPHRRTLPAQIDLRRACRRTGDDRTGAGSDVVTMRLRADRKGTTMFSTAISCGSPTAMTRNHRGLRQDRSAAGPRGITAFLIEKSFKGFTTGAEAGQARHARVAHVRMAFQDCQVPTENVLGEVKQGRQRADGGPGFRARGTGRRPTRSCRPPSSGVALCPSPRAVRHPIGEFQLVQGKLADIYTTLNASSAYVYAVARACDRGSDHAQGCGRRHPVRRPRPRPRWRSTQSRLLGGNGYINEYPTGRLLRDAKLYESAPAPVKSAAC